MCENLSIEKGESPLVSVIIAIYNVEDYLAACVESMLAQSFADLEILLVDDGSTDRSGALCDAYSQKDPRVRVVHKKNGGLSDARNAGMEAARGRYFVFVDGDDMAHPDMVKVLVEALLAHPELKMSAASFRSFTRDEEVEGMELKVPAPEVLSLSQAVRRRFWMTAWSKLYDRELFAQGGYPVGRYHEDEFMTYRLIHESGGLVRVEAQAYLYRQRPGSIMSQMKRKNFVDMYDAFQERDTFARAYNDPGFISFCDQCYGLLYYLMVTNGTPDVEDLKEKVYRECQQRLKRGVLFLDRLRMWRYLFLAWKAKPRQRG